MNRTIHVWTLAAAVAALTGCAVASTSARPAPRLPADLHVGSLDERTRFELEPSRRAPASESAVPDDGVDTTKRQRRRKGLFGLGVGMAGLGTLGTLGFGIGGRVVQAQINNGYDDGSLTVERADSLTSTGEIMNGLTIGSAVIGLAGVIVGATVYGIDHARCGTLPPRRKACPPEDSRR